MIITVHKTTITEYTKIATATNIIWLKSLGALNISVLLWQRLRVGRLQPNWCLGGELWAQCIALFPPKFIEWIGTDTNAVSHGPLHVQLQLQLASIVICTSTRPNCNALEQNYVIDFQLVFMHLTIIIYKTHSIHIWSKDWNN